MLFTNVLTYAVAFATATPMVAAEYKWDPKLQIHNIGNIRSQGPKMPNRAAQWMGRCGGDDIPLGGYGCGQFGSKGTAIYKCVTYKEDGKAWLQRSEVCLWNNAIGGQCVKNQLGSFAKFYPFVNGNKVVCVQPTDVHV